MILLQEYYTSLESYFGFHKYQTAENSTQYTSISQEHAARVRYMLQYGKKLGHNIMMLKHLPHLKSCTYFCYII